MATDSPRQFPIGPYFADFCCRSRKLVVEVDGSQHADSDYDRSRDGFMRSEGFSIPAVRSSDVLAIKASWVHTSSLPSAAGWPEDVVAVDLRFTVSAAHDPETGSNHPESLSQCRYLTS
ncbi:MAG: endonuclease domain-containing protein [Rhizobiaceae bacterium]|nr:endonuclease domain-containing protein [Rhizobiaceae bacterium]